MALYGEAKAVLQDLVVLFEKIRRDGYSILHLINREVKTTVDIPLRQRLWAYRHGYLSSSVPLYGLEEPNRHDYLSQWQSEQARQINGDAALVHENKLLFHYVLWPTFSDALPTMYGYLSDGRFLETPFSPDTDDSLRDCVERVGKLVVKPVGGTLGSDIHVIEHSDGVYHLNGEPVKAEQIDCLGERPGEYVVTEYIEQADYAAEIYEGSANTIRVMTMVDPKTQEPFIGALGHRFGTDESAPVDNTAKGGITAGVDLETGRLETAIRPPKDETLDRYTTHPGTGAAITGVELPGWDRIRERLLEMAAHLSPMTPYIGWDVLITDDDGSMAILEANSYPDVPLQTHEPLLADERVRRFYEYHGVM